jgi:cysteine synthase
MSVQVSVVASAEWANIVKSVVVTVIALEIQRAADPTPVSMFVTTVGTLGNVNPKLTTTVNDDNATKVIVVDPRRDQLLKFVSVVLIVASAASSAAISVA